MAAIFWHTKIFTRLFPFRLFADDGERALDPVSDIVSPEGVALAQVALLRDMEVFPGGLSRDRVAVDKLNILQSAEKLLVSHARTTARGAVLEVSFLGEKGSGTGVIREFCSLLANALREDRRPPPTGGAAGALAVSSSCTSDEGIASGRLLWHCIEDAPAEGGESGAESASAASDPSHVPVNPHVQIVHHPAGLFPRPLADVSNGVLRACGIVGRMIGQALQDSRMFPLPLSSLLFAVLLRLEASDGHSVLPDADAEGEPVVPTVPPLVASSSYSSLRIRRARAAIRAVLCDALLVDILQAYLPFVASSLLPAAQRLGATTDAVPTIGDDAAINNAWLTFEHPETGADLSVVELSAGGSPPCCPADLGISCDSQVTSCNVDAYVAALAAYTAWGAGVRPQLIALRAGVREVVRDSSWLRLVGGPEALRDLVCGTPRIDWTVSELQRHIVASHGYAHTDAAVRWFIKALLDMSQAERADFLQFATGQPTLPPGGIASLSPPLTVIRKTDGLVAPAGGAMLRGRAIIDIASGDWEADASATPVAAGPYDRLWVSASTCFNQVRVPPFSSLAVLQSRLRDSILLSRGLIDLS